MWIIKESELMDIKYFYGLCNKKEGDFKSKNNGIVKCAHFKIDEKYIKNKKNIENYSLDYQNKNYNPIFKSDKYWRNLFRLFFWL